MYMYSNELVCKILNYIDNNINKKITVEELSLRFYYNRYTPSKSNYKLITDNIIKINMLINKVNNYKLKTKPHNTPVRKLSIFK